jgi:hypothetical protein
MRQFTRCAGALAFCAALLAAVPSLAQTNPLLGSGPTTAVPPGDLALAVNAVASGNANIRLQPGGVYTLSEDITINDQNSGLVISSTGGNDTGRPDKTIIRTNGNQIFVSENTTLTLAEVTVQGNGGGASILMAAGSTLTMARCQLTQGSPSISVNGLVGGGAATVNLMSCVIAATNGGVLQNGNNTVVNAWQCTFLGTAPYSIQSTGGSANVVACLFETPGDLPRNLNTLAAANFRWTGSLVGLSNAMPPGYTQAGNLATDVSATLTAIPYKTVDSPFPGELDEGALPLVANATYTDTNVANDDVRKLAEKLSLRDFEGETRGGAGLQVGADELGANLFIGWESAVLDREFLAANQTVLINIFTRGIDLNNAVLRVVPELSLFSDPALDDVAVLTVPITVIDENLGQASFTAPSGPCIDGIMTDGIAQLYLLVEDTSTFYYTGDPVGSSVLIEDSSFTIDTLPPTYGTLSGVDAASLAYYRLAGETNSPALGADLLPIPAGWGPDITGGVAPSNAATLRSGANSPQVFMNWAIPVSVTSPVPEFWFSASFVDYPPEPCFDGGTTIPLSSVAGLESDTLSAASRAELPNLYGPVEDNDETIGRAFLYGEPPGDLVDFSGISPMTATATGSFDTSDGSDNLIARWTFRNFGFVPNWNAEFRVGASDRAGNQFLVPTPIRIWWFPPEGYIDPAIDGTRITLSGPGNDENPSFTWNVSRPVNPPNPEPSAPLASYRLWVAENPEDTSGAYSAVTAWSAYQFDRSITGNTILPNGALRLREFLELPDSLGQRFLMTVKVADQAGNIQENLVTNPIVLQAFVDDRIDNLSDFDNAARTFGDVGYVSWTNGVTSGGALDTRVRARLWWNRVNPFGPNNEFSEGNIATYDEAILNERDFGSSTRIPLPPEDDCGNNIYTRIEAEFVVTPSSTSSDRPVKGVRWELFQEGRLIEFVEVPINALGPIRLPEALSLVDAVSSLQSSPCGGNAAIGDRFGDEGDPDAGARARNIRYTFSARTYSSVPDPFDPLNSNAGIPVYDETPATFQFVVTVTDEFDGGEQPIKVFAPVSGN